MSVFEPFPSVLCLSLRFLASFIASLLLSVAAGAAVG